MAILRLVSLVLVVVLLLPASGAAKRTADSDGAVPATCQEIPSQAASAAADHAGGSAVRRGKTEKDSETQVADAAAACESVATPAAGQTPMPDETTPVGDSDLTPAAPIASEAIPADVLTAVEGCAVVTISGHDVAAAGCPGVGIVEFRTPDSAPLMPDTAMIAPVAPFAAPPASAPESHDAEPSVSTVKRSSSTPEETSSTRANRHATTEASGGKSSGKNTETSDTNDKKSKSSDTSTTDTSDKGSHHKSGKNERHHQKGSHHKHKNGSDKMH